VGELDGFGSSACTPGRSFSQNSCERHHLRTARALVLPDVGSVALTTEQLGGAVRAVPRDEVVGVAGDHEAVTAHLAEIDWRSEHLERALDESLGQVQVEEVRVQPGRRPSNC
jgi:hypothetical protein